MEQAIFMAEQNEDVAVIARFTDTYRATVREIAEHPENSPWSIHAPPDRMMRQRRINKFPNQLIFYSFDGQSVVIERVLHAARNLSVALLD